MTKMQKINIFLLTLVNVFYVFRGILTKFGLDNLVYIFSFLSFALSLVMLMTNKKPKKISWILIIFVFFGCICFLVSSVSSNFIGSLLGFVSFYFNFLILLLFYLSTKEESIDRIYSYFIKLNIVIGTISALFGIYQYYFDSSLFGFATHFLYSDAELLSSGSFVRRTTSFMGSPQNYAIYIALVFLMAFTNRHIKKIPKIVLCVILLFGGLSSGSRAFSLSSIIALIVCLLIKIYYKKGFGALIISFAIIGFVIVAALPILDSFSFGNRTIERVFTFADDWPALEVYKRNLSNTSFFEFLFGHGLGNGERLVYEYFGDRYSLIYGTDYASYESYFLSLLMQCGLFPLIIYFSFLLKTAIIFFRNKNLGGISICVAVFINMIFTPSFTGLAMSFICYLLLLYPNIKNTSRFNKSSIIVNNFSQYGNKVSYEI